MVRLVLRMGLLLSVLLENAMSLKTAVTTIAGNQNEFEPYHVVHIHMEEGVEDGVESRRRWEESKSEKKRVAELVESEQRNIAKLDAIAAAQQAQHMRVEDIVKQLKSSNLAL